MRGYWRRVVPSATAASLLATLSFASLCLCGDECIVAEPLLEGCGLPALQHHELHASVEVEDEACLGPCLDVLMLATGSPGDERPSAPAPGLVAAPDPAAPDGSRPSPLPALPRGRPGIAGHVGYTILRC